MGALDSSVRDFHGYTTNKGTPYNAHLVVDEKIALFDTVQEPFRSVLIQNIGQVVGSRQIDYMVVNHVESGHYAFALTISGVFALNGAMVM